MSQSNYLITKKVMPKFFLSLLITFAGMVIGAMFIPPAIAIFMPIFAIVLLIFAFFAKGKRSKTKKYDYASSRMTLGMPFVYFLAFILGIGMYPAIAHYLSDIGATYVLLGLGVTTVIFGGLALYAYKTKEDFSNMGAFLFVSLLALILLSIAGFFIQATLFHIVLSIAGVVIFSGYILYDISCMKRADFTEEDVPMAVLDLLLDFINIFLDVLRLISIFKN
ncbi:hypothetical protein CVD28_01605 [Bacillus sp. M6-12]|uniref:Bax inhibitor-1/YccA family protein n=1 Tax=Bacillus sp. M6-12 TaxID=2054166 RepID=UPI000C7574C7|nr:Bax inhibitor-1 family protein [Bacillus sp. M6-12]PLS19129.1 hypothetical protein CVD28_01605 [Bacillus sp. M6-12]